MCYEKQWKNKTKREKFNSLNLLAEMCGESITVEEGTYSYNIKTRTIKIEVENPSIISTLHEIGHALLGPNELYACAWSTQYFKLCFPREYEKLKWEGHMLRKK